MNLDASVSLGKRHPGQRFGRCFHFSGSLHFPVLHWPGKFLFLSPKVVQTFQIISSLNTQNSTFFWVLYGWIFIRSIQTRDSIGLCFAAPSQFWSIARFLFYTVYKTNIFLGHNPVQFYCLVIAWTLWRSSTFLVQWVISLNCFLNLLCLYCLYSLLLLRSTFA